MWGRLLAFTLVAGCGRLRFEEVASRSDGGGDLGDARDATTPCTFGPFTAPVRLPGPVQSPADDWYATPTSDELELYFYRYSGSAGDAEVVRATRGSVLDPFGAAVPVTELESAVDDTSVAITDDGLDLVLTRSGANTHLFEAQRASTAVPFPAPVIIASIMMPEDDLTPWLSPDGLRMTYTSRHTGAMDLYETTRTSRSVAWSTPVPLIPLNTASFEDNATESASGLEILFSSDRPGGAGGWDVYRAVRPALDQPFETPARVPELSSTRDDIGVRLSRDARRVYLNFSTIRAGGGNADISTASRVCQ